MNNNVLYYKHLCQRGKGPLYEGTSKSMEGVAARDIFKKMKEEGITIAVHWQDADSTAEKKVQKHFVDVTKLCGGHYTRAHYNQLKIKGQNSLVPRPHPPHVKERGSGDIRWVFLVAWVDFYIRGHV